MPYEEVDENLRVRPSVPFCCMKERTHHRAIRLELPLDHPPHHPLQLHQLEAFDLPIIRIRTRHHAPIRRKREVIDVLHLGLDPPMLRAIRVGEDGDGANGGGDEGGREGGFFGAFADDGFAGEVAGGDAACDGVVEVRGPAKAFLSGETREAGETYVCLVAERRGTQILRGSPSCSTYAASSS